MNKDNKNTELHNTDKKLHISDVSGSYTIGEKIIVCGELFTTIHHFDGDKVWFYDPYIEKLRYCSVEQIQHDDGTL